MAEKAQTAPLGKEFETKKIKSVEAAAKAYVTARDERMDKTKLEVEAKAVLENEMEKHNLETYRFDDGDVTREVVIEQGKEKVKVKTVEPGE